MEAPKRLVKWRDDLQRRSRNTSRQNANLDPPMPKVRRIEQNSYMVRSRSDG